MGPKGTQKISSLVSYLSYLNEMFEHLFKVMHAIIVRSRLIE